MTMNASRKATAHTSESPEKVGHAICDRNNGSGAGCPGEIDTIDAVSDDAAEGCAEQRSSTHTAFVSVDAHVPS
jgi:hypothetical protein